MTTLVLIAGSDAWAHTRLKVPVPRTNDDALKDNAGGAPCGGKPRQGTPAQWTTGQTVNVQFEETVNHAGCFLISLSQANDQNFNRLMIVAHSNTPTITAGNPRPYSAQVTLPAGVTCTACTLQLIQVMDAALPCPPVPIPVNESYYSCADVVISAPSAAGGGAAGAGGGVAGAGGGVAGTGGGTVDATGGGVAATGGGIEMTGAGGGTAETGTGGGSPAPKPAVGGGNEIGGGVAEGGCSTVGALSALAWLAAAVTLRRRRY